MARTVPERADVLVIGGGVIGLSVAYHAATIGASVVLLERGRLGSGASSANAGGISLATKKPGAALRLALAAVRRFRTLADELQYDIEYEEIPTLTLAENEAEWQFLQGLVAEQRAGGAAVELVDGARARALFPGLPESVLGASYSTVDAQVNPFQLVRGFAVAAERQECTLLQGVGATAIDVEHGRVRGVATDAGTIKADWVVNAAGAYSPAVGEMVGVTHAVMPQRGQALVLEPCSGLPRIRLGTAGQLISKHSAGPAAGHATHYSFSYSLKPRYGVAVLGSTHEFVGYDRSTTLEATTWMAAAAARTMPMLGPLKVLRTWAGLRPYHAEGPIIGRAGGPEGYIAATGHGGDGVSLSPVTGEHVAEMIRRGNADLTLDDLLPETAGA